MPDTKQVRKPSQKARNKQAMKLESKQDEMKQQCIKEGKATNLNCILFS